MSESYSATLACTLTRWSTWYFTSSGRRPPPEVSASSNSSRSSLSLRYSSTISSMAVAPDDDDPPPLLPAAARLPAPAPPPFPRLRTRSTASICWPRSSSQRLTSACSRPMSPSMKMTHAKSSSIRRKRAPRLASAAQPPEAPAEAPAARPPNTLMVPPAKELLRCDGRAELSPPPAALPRRSRFSRAPVPNARSASGVWSACALRLKSAMNLCAWSRSWSSCSRFSA
mmetsp:Transcript_16895/g.52045  ORF Transcript_16895/g.52045 Transcript_16895/m.52045 type:complete len:228 (+) Transcript_16895:432-1115(+)